MVVVESFDRMGRKASELLELVEAFLTDDVSVEALREGISTAGHAGRMILPFVAALSEAERVNIRERTRIGVEEAKRRGRIIGRPRVCTQDRAKLAAQMRADGRSLRQIASALKVSPTSVSRMLESIDGSRSSSQASLPLGDQKGTAERGP